jgi:hypothetical protein
MKDVAVLRNELRYADRLWTRQARLYRRIQTVGTFLTVLGSASAFSAWAPKAYDWLPILGGTVAAVFGAALIAIRPADKASMAEVQAKKYREATGRLDLEQALNKIRESDPHEIESLRLPVYNEVVREVGQDDYVAKLNLRERIINFVA